MICSDLVRHLAEKNRGDLAQAELIVRVVFECFTQAMLRGERIDIRGLGTFCVRTHKGYKGLHPRTGETIEVKPRRIPHFKPSGAIAGLINRAVQRLP